MSFEMQHRLAIQHLVSLGWTEAEARNELRFASKTPGYKMHDKDGNLIIDGKNLELDTDEVIDRAEEIQEAVDDAEQNHKEPGQEYYEQSKHFRDTGKPWLTLDSETKYAWKVYGRQNTELELELSSEKVLREKPPHDPDTAPTWTEVRGMTSFYYICPRCGAMIPGTGPKLPGPDGKERTPKEQHENWHKSQLIDWFDDNE